MGGVQTCARERVLKGGKGLRQPLRQPLPGSLPCLTLTLTLALTLTLGSLLPSRLLPCSVRLDTRDFRVPGFRFLGGFLRVCGALVRARI